MGTGKDLVINLLLTLFLLWLGGIFHAIWMNPKKTPMVLIHFLLQRLSSIRVVPTRTIICSFVCLTLCLPAGASLPEEVRTADASRVLATIAGDADRLAVLLSDHLSYGHADGRVQDKADFLAAVRSNRMRYEAYDYEEMKITPAGEAVAVMSGRARLRVRMQEQQFAFRLRFLAIWHRETEGWRLFAYQSTQLPAPDAD